MLLAMSVVAASPDGTQVAVIRGGEIMLVATATLTVVARAAAPSHERAIAFCGRTLLVHSVEGVRTVLTVLGLPKLEVVSQLEVDGATRLLAASQQYALIDRPDSAFIVHCTPQTAAVAPLRLPVTVSWAIGLEAGRFLIWSPRGSEVWDASSRRPTSRIALALSHDTRDIGVVGQYHWLWVLTGDQRLQASRLSDGRIVLLPVAAPIEDPIGHPIPSWLVADVGGEATAINVALRISMPVTLPSGPRLVLPSPDAASDALVLVVEPDRLFGITVSADPGRGGSVAGALPTAGGAPPRPPVAPTPVTPVLVAPPPAPRHTWRDDLLAWGRVVRQNPAEPLPFLVGSPLDDLITHAMLSESSARIVHALYAEWLEGRRDEGVAPAVLAELAGGAEAWTDALGTGPLGELGLIACELGRTRLVPAVGDFFDGRPPRSVDVVGGFRAPLQPRGVFRIAREGDETLRAAAERLAPSLGWIATCAADLPLGRLEAWLREAALLTDLAPGTLAPRPTETILWRVPAGAPDAPGAPPWWT